MPRSDRLLMLSTYRLTLRNAGLDSPEAVRTATPDQLAQLHQHLGEAERRAWRALR